MKFLPPFLAVSAAFTLAGSAFGQNATTTPVGAVTVTIAAGTGTAKVRSLVSVPLLASTSINGMSSGAIAAVTSNSITCSGAGWSTGELSTSSSPYLVRITSGSALGYTFLISTTTPNTSDTLYLDTGEASLLDFVSAGVASGDKFEIRPCDTLSSVFGTPQTTGVVGAAAPAQADTLVVNGTNGLPGTYYYNTTLGRWTKQAFGNPDASNLPIRPDAGILFARIGNSQLSITVTGEVPTLDRQASIRNSGVTYFSNSWPTDQTLSSLGLESVSGWLAGATPATSDIVVIGTSNYYYDGTNWRRQAFGNPISNPTITSGQSVIISKKGTASGVSNLSQTRPYSL